MYQRGGNNASESCFTWNVCRPRQLTEECFTWNHLPLAPALLRLIYDRFPATAPGAPRPQRTKSETLPP